MRYLTRLSLFTAAILFIPKAQGWSEGLMAQSVMGQSHPLSSMNSHALKPTLSPVEEKTFEQLKTNFPNETGLRFVYAGWRADGDYAFKQSLSWAAYNQEPTYFKEILFLISLGRDPNTGSVSLPDNTHPETPSSNVVTTQLLNGILTIGDYQFQTDGNMLISWRESPLALYESLAQPIEIPPFILDRFRTQA